MRTSLERKVSLGIGAAVFMLCVIGIVSYQSIHQYITNAAWNDHTRLVLATIAEASNQITDVEDVARGFVITGDELGMARYQAATARVGSELRELRKLTSDNPRQQQRLDRLGPLVLAKMAATQQAVDLRRRSGFEASRDFTRGGEGGRAMDALRGTFDEMKGEEERLLKERAAAEQASASRTITIISIGSALALVLVAVAGWMIRRDIIARRKAETVLLAAEERFRLLVEGVRDYAIIMLDVDGHIASWNGGAERIKGYKADEIVGQHFSRFYTAEDLRQGKPARELKAATETGRYEEEGWRVRKDGSTFWANVVIAAVRDARGTLRGFAKVTRDVSARKRAEDDIRKLNAAVQEHAAQLEVTNRELEAFSYSVSHDLRAPLRSIDGFSQALLEDYADKLGEDGKDSLRRVRAATQRMGQLIDDMLNLSRVTRAELKPEAVDLSTMATDVVAELRKGAPERVVEVVVEDGLTAWGDARLLRVVLDNLIGNAWKFTGRREDARIEVGRSADGAFYVRDNGAGFDMAYAQKLFGAFQQLHAMDEFSGTGVGLATVQRIVHRHGGRAWAEGSVGEGATFSFTIAPDGATLNRAA